MKGKEYFISGIDTNCGKTYITGLLAYQLRKAGARVITSKLVQTGCKGISEDIIEHRRIMDCNLFPEDIDGSTCPFVYSFPASPHLSAKIDGIPINLPQIRKSFDSLTNKHDIILSEGAGGLMVPITENYLTIDYIKEYSLPLILVSSSKLGSINHTLLSIEACMHHQINLYAIIYNQMPNDDALIAKSSYEYLHTYLSKILPKTYIFHNSILDKENDSFDIDFLVK